MRLPPQAPPVQRPELVAPHRVVELLAGRAEVLVRIRIDLLHGANFNDPQHFAYPTYERMRLSVWRGGWL